MAADESERLTRDRVFRTLIEESADIISRFDRQLRHLFVNRAVTKATGRPASDFIGKTNAELGMPPDLVEFWATVMNRVIDRGIEETMEFSFLAPDGRLTWFRTRIVPEFDAVGTVESIVSVAHDVTEAKAAEDARVEGEREKLVNLIEHSSDFIAMSDMSGRLTYMNTAGRRLIGLEDHDLPSVQITDYVAPEWIDFFRTEMIPRLMKEGQWQGEMQLMNMKTHERIDVARSTYVIRDPFSGTPLGLGTVTRDIREQKRAAEELRRSEEMFRTLADNISQFTWMAEPDGSVFWYNRRWYDFTGTTLETMRGWGWKAVHHPEHVDRVAKRFKEAVDAGREWEDTFPLRGADGQYRWFLSRALPIRDAGGNVVRWFGTNTDVTELRDTQEALRHADRLKDEFLATLSHELRTPLTAIVGWAELLLRGMHTAEEMPFAVETIYRSAKAQAAMIEDVLDVSRIISGKMRLERKMCDPRAVVEAALATIAPAAEAKGTRVTSNVEDVGEMYLDPDRLEQILWNLLTNAIKFSPRGAHVELSLRREADAAVFEVRDDGPGIAKEFLPHAFERFRQGDSSTRRLHGGLGIGLSLVKDLAMMHGGSVAAKSEQGHGAAFRVTLPIVVAGRNGETSPVNGVPSKRELDGIRVLVVEDDHDTRLMVAAMLRIAGAEAAVAASVQDALEMIRNERPAVVITDIAMPERDGFDLLDAVRSSSSARLPVIALTAHPAADENHSGAFDAYLNKPIDTEQLVRSVARAARRA